MTTLGFVSFHDDNTQGLAFPTIYPRQPKLALITQGTNN